MNILIKNATIHDPNSEFDGKTLEVLVRDGAISEIGKRLSAKGAMEVDGSGSVLSPGFFDLNCHSGDPGFETKEDLETLTGAAAAGGYTGIAVMPKTKPVVQTKSAIEYIFNRTRNNLVSVHPVGAVSLQLAGKEMAEMYDMHLAGAVAFSDGNVAISDDGFMSRAMQYVQGFGGLLISFPQNQEIAAGAQVNESANSVLLGMKGNPALAEEMQVSRDLFLAGYHQSPIHITSISTTGSVNLIRRAKKEGIRVTCDVAAHHLVLSEEVLEGFDTHFKVNPPLRTKKDIKSLLAGLKDGTIDAISSQHTPHEIEHKAVEFQMAEYGMIALQTVLPVLLSAGLSYQQIAEKLSVNPRKLLNLPVPSINPGESANLVLYHPTKTWTFHAPTNFSKSSNSPFFHQELTGRVQLIIHNSKYNYYESIH